MEEWSTKAGFKVSKFQGSDAWQDSKPEASAPGAGFISRIGVIFAAIQDDIAFWCSGHKVPIAQVFRVAQNENAFPTMMIPINDSHQGVTFAIKVHPRAKKNAITGELGDALKLSLTTPPVEGRANEACIEFFARLLKVPRSSVTIASGQTSRNKVIRVLGLCPEEVRHRLYEAD